MRIISFADEETDYYFPYQGIDPTVVGNCPTCGAEAYDAEEAKTAQAEYNPSHPLAIPAGMAWCSAGCKAIKPIMLPRACSLRACHVFFSTPMPQQPHPTAAAQALETQAYALGREAMRDGRLAVPAQDANLWPLLRGLAVGEGKPVLQAWVDGFRREQDEQQIRVFAAELNQGPEVEQQLQAGLTEAERRALWWRLFDQRPDAA